MKRIFMFTLMLAMFVALTGGYGQILNSDWVSRSFTSAEEVSQGYPVLEVGAEYHFQANDTGTGGPVLEQNGRWVLVYYSNTNRNYWVNLDNIVHIKIEPSTKDN